VPLAKATSAEAATYLAHLVSPIQMHFFLRLQRCAPVIAQIYTHIYPRGGIVFACVFGYSDSQEKMLISTAVKEREYKVHEAQFSCALSSKHGGGRLSRIASFFTYTMLE
jgi:hypothetical protein